MIFLSCCYIRRYFSVLNAAVNSFPLISDLYLINRNLHRAFALSFQHAECCRYHFPSISFIYYSYNALHTNINLFCSS
jgi:hypothetical protein